MSASNGKRNRGRVPYVSGKQTPWQPGDEQEGGFSRAALLKMDSRFCVAMKRAIRLGLERRPDSEAPKRAA